MDKSMKLVPDDSSKERQSLQTSSTDSPPPSPSSQSQIIALSPNDDDSITTSTESSETFEAWTLVMDKQKLKDENRVEIVKDNEHVDQDIDEEEVGEAEEEKHHDKELQDSSNDIATDDLSDGISIISESESNGRFSPHPYLRDHLHDLTLKFATTQHDDDKIMHKLIPEAVPERIFLPAPVTLPDQQQQIRQRPVRSTNEPSENKDKALQKSSQTVAESRNFPPLLKRGLQGIFYIGVALAILGLIGKIRNPTWQPLAGSGSNSPSAAELEQKVSDLELQNNFMRAEIDLLNKQVKYLNSLNEPQAKKSGKYKAPYEDSGNHREGKTFKAWPGNGESLRPVDITKEDLKSPYKCPDGTFTEFAGMCVEKKRKEPNIVEQFEQVVDDFKQQSETMQTFEKVAQKLHGFTESPFEQIKQILTERGNQEQGQQEESLWKKPQEANQPNEFIKNKPVFQAAEEQRQQYDHKDQSSGPNSPGAKEYERRPSSSAPYEHKDFVKCKPGVDSNCLDSQFKKPYDAERKDYKKSFEHQSKERFDKFNYPTNGRKHKFDRRDSGDDGDSAEAYNRRRADSKERLQKRNDENFSKRDDDSKEHFRKRDNDSKERFNKRSRENSSKERFQKPKSIESGEWQEQYMKHRESARKLNEQKYNGDNKNWYIKRGDSREHKRNADIRYR